MKVTVLGAAGGIGQPLSLLLKLSPHITELALFDIRLAKGVAQDLSHINTNCKVVGYEPASKEDTTSIAAALKGTDIVLIPAGVPRKPGMTRDDLFKINATIIKNLATSIAINAPNAAVLVISNPVNSTVPIVAEVFKKYGVFNPKKLFGITTLDIVRANTFIKDYDTDTSPNSLSVDDIKVDVVGGHSGETIVPLYSISNSRNIFNQLSKSQQQALIKRVQFGGDEVVKAKNGAGSATLSMAYSGYKFTESLISAMLGLSSNVVENTFIYLNDSSAIKGVEHVQSVTGSTLSFISLPVKLGKSGADSVDFTVFHKISSDEVQLLNIAIATLQKNIEKGVSFVSKSKL